MRYSEYGVEKTYYFRMIVASAVDYATSGDWTPASGDCKVIKDGAASANSTNLPSYESDGVWSLTLTAAEHQCASLSIAIIDSATKAVEDNGLEIETYGHASAMHEAFPANATQIGSQAVELSSDNRLSVDVAEWNDIPLATTNPLPNAAADAAGGLPISDAGGLDMDSLSTFDASTDEVTTDTASRNASKATGFSTLTTGDIDNRLAAFNWSGITISAVSGAVGSVTGAVGSVTAGVTVSTNNDKTGYDLNADQSGVTIGTVNTLTGHTAQTGDSFARLGSPAGASIAADISGVSGLDAAGVRDAIGMASANLDTQLAGLAGDQGSGANSITPTVDDGTDPLESAKLRFTKGAESYIATTNASGTFTNPFLLDNGTWTVSITLPGYTFTQTTLVVTGDATPTYSMTSTGSSAPDAPIIRGQYTLRNKVTKQPVVGERITAEIVSAANAAGQASVGGQVVAESDGNGVCTFYVLPGEQYEIIDPRGNKQTVSIPTDATDPHSMGSVVV